MIDSAVKQMNCKINNLIADFSDCNINTISTLFNSYCMNVNGCQLWKFNDNCCSRWFNVYKLLLFYSAIIFCKCI